MSTKPENTALRTPRRGLVILALAIPALILGRPDVAEAVGRAELLKSYEKAGAWLLKTQNKNGSWGTVPGQADPGELGLTGLVTVGFLEAPEELRAKYRPACAKAIAWMLPLQRDDGSFTHARSGLTTYRTALTLMALKAFDAKAHAAAIARAQKYLTTTQFTAESGAPEDNPHHGGWGYDKTGVKPDADMSNSAFAIQALKASGLSEDDPAFKRALLFITRCQNNSETNKGVGKLKPSNDGGYIYDPGLNRNKSMAKKNADGTLTFESYAGMTYTGLLSLLLSKVKKDDPRVKAAMRWIRAHYTLKENYGLGVRNPKKDAAQQGLYYYYMNFAKCLDAYGEAEIETKQGKRNWAQDLAEELLGRQQPQGFWLNEQSERWWEGNPLVPTSYTINGLNRVLKNIK